MTLDEETPVRNHEDLQEIMLYLNICLLLTCSNNLICSMHQFVAMQYGAVPVTIKESDKKQVVWSNFIFHFLLFQFQEKLFCVLI